jgi:hypothetical protein
MKSRFLCSQMTPPNSLENVNLWSLRQDGIRWVSHFGSKVNVVELSNIACAGRLLFTGRVSSFNFSFCVRFGRYKISGLTRGGRLLPMR